MAKISVQENGNIGHLTREVYGASRVSTNINGTTTERSADKLVITQADGTVYILTGENLEYYKAGDVLQGRRETPFDVEGMIKSGTLTGMEKMAPNGDIVFKLEDDAMDITILNSGYLDLNSTGRSSGMGNKDIFDKEVEGGDDIVTGSNQNDDISLGFSHGTFRGRLLRNDGNDVINAKGGDDKVVAGLGEDIIEGGAGNDILYGDYDSVPRSRGGRKDPYKIGDNDKISGGTGNDELYGGGGDDILDGGAGDDKINGGSGSDTILFSTGNDHIDGYATNILLKDRMADTSTDTVIFGKALSDFDSVTYESSTYYQLSAPQVEIPQFTFIYKNAAGETQTTTIRNIEKFDFTDKDLTLAEMIKFVDDSTASNGNEVKDIASENQDLTGTSDNDTFVINSASTNYNWSLTEDGTGIVVWNIETNKSDLLFGFEHINFNDINIPIADLEAIISGTANGDYIDFSHSNNTETQVIQANEGNDAVFGGEGEDIIYGGEGNDTLIGDYAINPNAGHGTTNAAHHIGQADRIFGGKGNDKILGQGGNDTINGGQGNDTMSGGFGSDTFILSEGNDSVSGGRDDFTYFEGIDTEVTDTLDLTMATTAFNSITYQTETSYKGVEFPVFTFTWTDSAGNVNTTTAKGIEKFDFTDKNLTLNEMIKFVDDQPTTGENLVHDIADINQELTGTTPNDIFVIKGKASDYGWGATDDGKGIVVWNDKGYDILTGFEAIQFSDIKVALVISDGKYQDIPSVTQFLQGQKGGNDVFVIDGEAVNYGWGETADGQGVVVWNELGVNDYDILHEFEGIQFNDQTVSLADFSA